jgi:sec-independent protein translocase protein TatA
MISGNEILIVAIIAVFLLFSGKKIPELMNSVGRALGEFKKGRTIAEKEVEEALRQGKEEVGSDLEENKKDDEKKIINKKNVKKN